MSGSDSPRALAVRTLLAVLQDGETLTVAAERAAAACTDLRDAALLKELCYGTLRWQLRLQALLNKLVERPLKSADLDLQLLLLLGLYQLSALRIPAHAAVQQTVEICRDLRKPWATKLVNGVLRRYLRERETLDVALQDDPVARYAHPRWFVGLVQQDWPGHWQAILEAGNQRPPLTLRVNRRRLTRDDYLQKLATVRIEARACSHAEDGVTLAAPMDVKQLPGFDAGECSVQDEAAQLAAELLDLKPGLRVLDACAAPGGKTCHILERQADLAVVVAVEQDAGRAGRIRENLQRLRLKAELVVADAAHTRDWWDGKVFDRILLDAPCSASGVIRRHPDIKLLRTPMEVDQAVALQRRLLGALWPLLAPGGKLLYATCSVLGRENAMQVDGFLAVEAGARAVALPSGWGTTAGAGRQILSGEDGMDGFYYACLEKRA